MRSDTDAFWLVVESALAIGVSGPLLTRDVDEVLVAVHDRRANWVESAMIDELRVLLRELVINAEFASDTG